MQFLSLSQKLFHFLGSSLSLPAHGWVGARATSSLAAHFVLQNTASNSAEKKGSPSEGVAEGGGWGEKFRHARAVAKRFRRLALSQTSKQNNFQILLRKIWRAKCAPRKAPINGFYIRLIKKSLTL